ncbi:hypothetical protein TNCT_699961, partial [Trichonephila clavata]
MAISKLEDKQAESTSSDLGLRKQKAIVTERKQKSPHFIEAEDDVSR